MTKDQEDTRDWIEQTLRFFDPRAKLEHISTDTDLLTMKASFTSRSSQYVQIHANGKPAWDGERNHA